MTTDRNGRTVAFVRAGDTPVNEELIRQVVDRVFTRYCDRPVCEQWERLETEGTKRETRFVVNAECNPTAGVYET